MLQNTEKNYGGFGMIYLVEDDESIRELVVYTLNSQGMEARGFEKPSLFWKAMEKERPSLVLLDIMLPEEGRHCHFEKLRVRPDTRRLPVMLTARGSEYDTVMGLDSGADDYIPKPFRMMELISASARASENLGLRGKRISCGKTLRVPRTPCGDGRPGAGEPYLKGSMKCFACS